MMAAGSSNLFAQNQNICYDQFYERPEIKTCPSKSAERYFNICMLCIFRGEVGGKSARVSPNRLPKFGGNTLKS
jgi:hypothetical protein